MKFYRYCFVLVLITVNILIYSQEYKFSFYGQHEGLTDVFINTINQDENGYLIVGTGQGVGFYDGRKFTMKTTKDNLVDNYISTSFKDSENNIWFGHNQGGVTKYSNSLFTVIHPGEGINSLINGIQEDSKGNIWFSTQSFGLFFRNKEGKIHFFNKKFEDKIISSLYIDENDYLFLGVDSKLEVYKFIQSEDGNFLSKVQNVNKIEDDVEKIITLDDGRKVLATKSLGLFSLEQKEKIFVVTPISISNFNGDLLIKDIYLNAGRIWISTYGDGLIRAILTNNNCFVSEAYSNKNGLVGENNVSVTFIDREGVLWLGTAGDGLLSKEDNFFTFYFKDRVKQNDVTYLSVSETEIWTATRGQITCYDKQYATKKQIYNFENSLLPMDEITSFLFLEDSTLLVGTSSKGFYYKKNKSPNFEKLYLSDDVLSNHVTTIAASKDFIWVGTQNGVYRIKLDTEEIFRYSMRDGLSHNSIKNIYVTKSDEVFIGTNSAYLNIIDGETVRKLPFQEDNNDDYISVSVTKIIEDKKGNIWVSSQGQGVFCFTDTNMIRYDTRNGMLNNYSYAIAMDDKDKVWVSHDAGLSSIDSHFGQIETFDSRYGLNAKFSISAIDYFKSEIWFGTQNGVVKYNSKESTKNNVPPITSFGAFVFNDEDRVFGIMDTVLPAGEHNIEFSYNGISLKKSKGLKYKYIFEGYDEKWSELTEDNSKKYTKVREGNYVFKVKSFNDDGVEGNMISMNISIRLPYYKQWWFYTILLIVLITVLVSIIKYRERQQVNYLKKLSSELDLRTSELVEQKEKMEEINKDLTDSINYAQHIQSAILPEDAYIKKLFPQSFIIFKPRDIVSGDFYWLAEYSDKKIIVFADCTGHGVPGGFMSMIGRILLRETCTIKNLRDPGVILNEIDNGLVNVLRQKNDIASNKDGMDLGVCVIDSNTNLMSFAGAMRPLYVYRDGVRNIIKGSRHSVGGIGINKKTFKTEKFQLESKDILYMFSDGYPDQFGGSRGRKMKISVLNELLDQVCQMPFESQGNEINAFFETWKGEEPQMDDVLMIGVQIQ